MALAKKKPVVKEKETAFVSLKEEGYKAMHIPNIGCIVQYERGIAFIPSVVVKNGVLIDAADMRRR